MSIEVDLLRARYSEHPVNLNAGITPTIGCSPEAIAKRFSGLTINP